ncbi:MAG: 4-vinyl reductase [Synergistaceae bacterium]
MNVLDLTQPLNNFIAEFQKILAEEKVGILRVERLDEKTGSVVLTVEEDLDCSGLPPIGETVCNYDEGFIAGVFEAYTKQKYIVKEIDCWATGSRVCRFNADIKK